MTTSATDAFTPYEPRAVRFLGVREVQGYRVKTYSILHASQGYSPELFESGLRFAAAHLPPPHSPTDTPHAPHSRWRPGLAFAILHQGLRASSGGGDYFILAWWDRENELPLRVFVRDSAQDDSGKAAGATSGSLAASGGWRAASVANGESICIWDLQVLWHERQAYIDTVLNSDMLRTGKGDEAEREYLARGFEVMA